MRIASALLSGLVLVFAGCDPAPPIGVDAGPRDAGSEESDAGMDAGAPDTDAGPDAGGGVDGGPTDGGPLDAGPACGPTQHLCDGICTDEMADDVANGCRLGCGDPCPGPGAICNPSGTCGIQGCVPMTCEELATSCGPVDDGCGTLMGCGVCSSPTRCESGQCVCDPDILEGAAGNESLGDASELTGLTDQPDSMVMITTPTIHRTGDVDWYRAGVENNCCGGDPVVEVTLDGLPSGEDYDLAIWYDCPGAGVPTCTTGTFDDSFGSGGCRAGAVGADSIIMDTNCDPDGVLFVRVTPFQWGGNCDTYQLTVEAR